MEPEQLQNFNERLSQWVANQGFWFQVRYSMSGSGMKGRAMFHLLRIGFRILIFLLLAALGTWIYLVKRTDYSSFSSKFQSELTEGLSATELEMRGFNRLQGQLEIGRLAAEGGDSTFFSALEARNIRCKMGLVDGLVGIWKPGIISISRLDIDLRAGTDDAESAQKIAEAIFRKSDKIEVGSFEVADATVRWGYSERTQGAIEGSSMKMLRTGTGWRLSFKGGTFRQNWLRNFEIVNLVVLCESGGLVFEKAEMKQRGGSLDFSGLRLIGGERPQLQGTAKIRHITLEEVMPAAFRTFLEGSISGDFNVFGSTNTSDGIGFEGEVELDGAEIDEKDPLLKDSIVLRERIHILKALSVVDYSRNYHRIDFREGTFQMKTLRGGMELTDVKLKAEDLFTLEGRMLVRLPTQDEIQSSMQRNKINDSSIFGSEDEAAANEELRKKENDFSLRRAAQAARVKDGSQSADTLSLSDKLSLNIDMRDLQNQASERMSRMLQYEGMFRITVPGDAFERAPRLQAIYPIDSATGRIPMNVPLQGNLYDLTLEQAEDIYEKGER